MSNTEGRRPLKTRDKIIFKNIASWLSQKNITPNQISVASVLFAFLSSICLLLLPYSNGSSTLILPIAAALFIQCRLLCNLFDGMVAVEGGKKTNSGEMFNDIPDRIADALIFVSAGYAVGMEYGSELGWCAALLAVMTAYIRTLSVSIGAPIDFLGPMAKQHRMAVMTIACLLTPIENFSLQSNYVLFTALTIIVIGCIFTIYRRTVATYNYLENNENK